MPDPSARPDARGWVSVELLRATLRRLNHAWRELPPAVTRRWWATLAVGAVVTHAAMAASVAVARRLEAGGALAWEHAALGWFATRAPISFNTGMWIEAPANGFILWALVLYCAGVAAWQGYALRCVTFLVGYTVVYLPILLGWALWDRDRPDLIANGMGTPAGFNSFPSGHVVQAVFVYGLLATLWIRATPRPLERLFALLVPLLVLMVVAVGRLRLGAHWPSDLVAGALVGGLWLAFCAGALARGEQDVANRVS